MRAMRRRGGGVEQEDLEENAAGHTDMEVRGEESWDMEAEEGPAEESPAEAGGGADEEAGSDSAKDPLLLNVSEGEGRVKALAAAMLSPTATAADTTTASPKEAVALGVAGGRVKALAVVVASAAADTTSAPSNKAATVDVSAGRVKALAAVVASSASADATSAPSKEPATLNVAEGRVKALAAVVASATPDTTAAAPKEAATINVPGGHVKALAAVVASTAAPADATSASPKAAAAVDIAGGHVKALAAVVASVGAAGATSAPSNESAGLDVAGGRVKALAAFAAAPAADDTTSAPSKESPGLDIAGGRVKALAAAVASTAAADATSAPPKEVVVTGDAAALDVAEGRVKALAAVVASVAAADSVSATPKGVANPDFAEGRVKALAARAASAAANNSAESTGGASKDLVSLEVGEGRVRELAAMAASAAANSSATASAASNDPSLDVAGGRVRELAALAASAAANNSAETADSAPKDSSLDAGEGRVKALAALASTGATSGNNVSQGQSNSNGEPTTLYGNDKSIQQQQQQHYPAPSPRLIHRPYSPSPRSIPHSPSAHLPCYTRCPSTHLVSPIRPRRSFSPSRFRAFDAAAVAAAALSGVSPQRRRSPSPNLPRYSASPGAYPSGFPIRTSSIMVGSPGGMVGGAGDVLITKGSGGGMEGEGHEGEMLGDDAENEEEREEEDEGEDEDDEEEGEEEREEKGPPSEGMQTQGPAAATVPSSEANGIAGSGKTWKDILLSVKAASQPGRAVPGSNAGRQEGVGVSALAAVAAEVVTGMDGGREGGVGDVAGVLGNGALVFGAVDVVGGTAGKSVGAIGEMHGEACRQEGWKRARSVATGVMATGGVMAGGQQHSIYRGIAEGEEEGGMENEKDGPAVVEGEVVGGVGAEKRQQREILQLQTATRVQRGEGGWAHLCAKMEQQRQLYEAQGEPYVCLMNLKVSLMWERIVCNSVKLLGALESPTRWPHLCAKMEQQRQLYEAQDDSRATQLSDLPDEFIVQILSRLTDPLDWTACLVLSRRFAALSCLALQALYLLPNRLLPKPLLARYLACYPNLAVLYLPWNSVEVEGDDVFEMIALSRLELQALHVDVFPGYNERSYARTPAGLTTLFTALPSLRYLALCTGRYIRSLPASIARLSLLEELLIMNQSSKLGLRSLPPALGQLSNLRRLVLDSCLQLPTLPEEIGQLTGLEELELLSLDCLRQLPESIGQLQCLKWFKMCWCMSVRNLPESIGQLKELEEMVINMAASETWLGSLKELPQSFGQLYSLRFLKIVGCPLMLDLPECFGQLYQLEEFVFDNKGFAEESEACGLLSLPDSFGQLTSLVRLELRNCFALTSLPESLGHLPYLYSLKLIGCYSLATLPESLGSSGSLQLLLVDNKVDDDEDEEEDGDGDEDGEEDGMSIVSHSTAMDMHMSMNGTDDTAASDDGASTGRNEDGENHDNGHYDNNGHNEEEDEEDEEDDDDDDGPSGLLALPSSMGITPSAMCNLRQLVLRANVSLTTLPPAFFSLHLLESLVLDFTETRNRESFSDPPASRLGSRSASQASLSGSGAVGLGSDAVTTETGSAMNSSLMLILPADLPTTLEKKSKPAGIAELPEEISQLVNLRRLDLIGCSKLSKLPESLGSLQFLQRLVVAFCPAIQALPAGVGQLKFLQTFVVQNCPNLRHLPESLTALAGLPELCIDEKSVGVKIPDHLLRLPGFRRDSCFFEDRLFIDLIE
ncbi:unnamed protein product [Closterium sp. NIES-65]|nr:unnamed protein product [Closterium sp. NIES-65]